MPLSEGFIPPVSQVEASQLASIERTGVISQTQSSLSTLAQNVLPTVAAAGAIGGISLGIWHGLKMIMTGQPSYPGRNNTIL